MFDQTIASSQIVVDFSCLFSYWNCLAHWCWISVVMTPQTWATWRFDKCCDLSAWFLTTCFLSLSQGENPIYKSAVTTVVNPKYEGKWWSFAFTVTTLYGKEKWAGVQGGAGFIMLSLFFLFVCCCSHQMIAMHFATISVCFTNLVCFLCIIWNVYSLCKCEVLYCIFCLCRTWENVFWIVFISATELAK